MLTISECSGREVLPRIAALLRRAFAAHEGRVDPPPGAALETAESLAEKLEQETLLVAECGGELAGCAWCRPEDKDTWYIGRLAVEPTLQGRGIAGALLEAGAELARTHGAQRMALGVRVEMTENIAFFERHRFAITGEASHPGYDRPTNYRMERDL